MLIGYLLIGTLHNLGQVVGFLLHALLLYPLWGPIYHCPECSDWKLTSPGGSRIVTCTIYCKVYFYCLVTLQVAKKSCMYPSGL